MLAGWLAGCPHTRTFFKHSNRLVWAAVCAGEPFSRTLFSMNILGAWLMAPNHECSSPSFARHLYSLPLPLSPLRSLDTILRLSFTFYPFFLLFVCIFFAFLLFLLLLLIIKSTFSKFTDDTKVGRKAPTTADYKIVQSPGPAHLVVRKMVDVVQHY